MGKVKKAAALGLLVALPLGGCVPARGGGGVGGLLFAIAGTAIVTAAIVSSQPPPPPRVVYAPEPRQGYSWQPGYWIRQEGRWSWVEGRWIALPPGYIWSPAHWVAGPDHTWRLVPGQWVPAGS
jgi:hypothetical protein